MIESDPLSLPTARGCRTKTTFGSLQRCSVWVQQIQNKNDIPEKQVLRSDKYKSDASVQFKDAEISQDELSELSSLRSRKPRKSTCNTAPDDTEVDTSVGSEVPSHLPLKKKELRSKHITLTPVCGWKNCRYSSTDLVAYVSHVSLHLPDIEIKISVDTDDEEVYLCLWESCDFETPNADEVSRHVNFHSYHTKMKCLGSALCQELQLPDCHFDTDGVNLVPDLPAVFECNWDDCSYTSNNPNKFYSHVQFHVSQLDGDRTRDQVIVFRCGWRGCKSEARKKSRLGDHLRTHTKEKVIACPTCGSLFASRMKLIDHRKRQSEELPFQCSYCSRSYSSERLLRDHMRHHVNNYKCRFCDMTCPSPHMLSHHIRHRHLDERPFKCDFCSYRSKTQYNMKRHLGTHSSSLNFACEDCDFKCQTIYMLNWHFRKVHEPAATYCCHMCDCRYSRGAYLTQHLMKKHNFRWPSGHSRFRYKNDEDGLFRLQTVRYESLDVVEDINRGNGLETSVLQLNGEYKIRTKLMSDRTFGAKVVVNKKYGEEDDPDDPDECNSCFSEDQELVVNTDPQGSGGPSMPILDDGSPHSTNRKVLISIDEIDTSGNVIRSSTMEADELVNCVDENAHVILDGDCLM